MDMILSRYGSGASIVFDMEWERGIKLIGVAKERITEEHDYQRWISGYDKEMSYDEFIGKLRPKENKNNNPRTKKDTRSAAEILSNVRGILEMEIE